MMVTATFEIRLHPIFRIVFLSLSLSFLSCLSQTSTRLSHQTGLTLYLPVKIRETEFAESLINLYGPESVFAALLPQSDQ